MQIKLFRTTTFRLTALASLSFLVIVAAVLAYLYLDMIAVIDRQINGALQREYADLTAAYQAGGYDGLKRTVFDRASPHYDSLRLYLLVGPDGATWGNLAKWPAGAPGSGTVADVGVDHAAGKARVRTIVFADGSRLLVGRALTELADFRRIVEQSLLGGLVATLVLGIAAGMLLARYARRRLARINRNTDEVLAGNLSGRIEVGEGGDEYDLLARNINVMLDRIELLLGTIRGVTENIAHDLRTPLNRLRGRLELALMAERSGEDYRAALQRAIDDADSIVETFNGLLKIARIKSGSLDLPRRPVDVREVIAEVVELYEVLAEESGVHIEAHLPPAGVDLTILGDGHLVSQAVANLVDNAIKYSPAGGTVLVSAGREHGVAGLAVADNGPGIPADMRTVILGRFVRLETGRSKQGFGLGLSLAAAVAEWHGATLDLADNHPGLCVTLRFGGPHGDAG
ncbi:MAG: HAMP domain-containing sensor histidine kinase [Hyphomicrobiales bacterium]